MASHDPQNQMDEAELAALTFPSAVQEVLSIGMRWPPFLARLLVALNPLVMAQSDQKTDS